MSSSQSPLLNENRSVIGSARRPSFAPLLSLKCPYCRQENLRQPGSWFEFAAGCSRCGYRYEREAGYFTNASWMINFSCTATLAFLLVIILVWAKLAISSTQIAIIVTVFIFSFGILIFPYSQALWIYIEHRINPLVADDRWFSNVSLNNNGDK